MPVCAFNYICLNIQECCKTEQPIHETHKTMHWELLCIWLKKWYTIWPCVSSNSPKHSWGPEVFGIVLIIFFSSWNFKVPLYPLPLRWTSNKRGTCLGGQTILAPLVWRRIPGHALPQEGPSIWGTCWSCGCYNSMLVRETDVQRSRAFCQAYPANQKQLRDSAFCSNKSTCASRQIPAMSSTSLSRAQEAVQCHLCLLCPHSKCS